MVVPGIQIEVAVAFCPSELVLRIPALVWGSHVNIDYCALMSVMAGP